MDKKIRSCFLSWIVLFTAFTSVLQMDGMKHHTFEENVPEKFPDVVAQMPKSKEIEILKEGLIEAKLESMKTILKSRNDGKGEVYLYDERTGRGSIFEPELIPLSTTLKKMLKKLGGDSLLVHVPSSIFPNSSGTIKSLHKMLEGCKSLQKKENVQKCSSVVTSHIQQFDFNTLISVLGLAHYFEFDKEIINPLVKKIQEKTDILFDENKHISLDELNALHTMNVDLLQNVLSVKWDIFLEKMRFSIAKNKKIGSKPIFHTYSGPLNAVGNIVFSPDQKHLLVTTGSLPASFNQPPDISCIYVINMDGSIYKKIVEVTHNVVWIDNDRFAYVKYDEIVSGYTSLNIFNCATEQSTPIPFGNSMPVIHRIIFNNNKIMFVYEDRQGKYGIGTCDARELKTIQYTLFDWEDSFLVNNFFVLENNEFILVGSPTDNLNKKELYELKEISDKPVPIVELFDPGDRSTSALATRSTISLDRKKIACFIEAQRLDIENRQRFIVIYSFETKQQVKCIMNKEVYSLQFDAQGKMLMVGCKDEILIFSAITGEKIGEFKRSDNQAFEHNWSFALSLNDNRLVVGAHGPLQTILQHISGKLVPNLLIWELIPDTYLTVWDKFINKKQLSLNQRMLLISLYYRSREGRKPVILTTAEKESFDRFDSEIQQLLTDIGYVAPRQMSKQPVKIDTSGYKPKTQPLKEAGREMLKSGRSSWEWLKANFSWDSLMKYLPGSG